MLSNLLTAVHARLGGFREARNIYARRLAPGFNVVSLLRPDELRLSVVLAELLDPAGSHAQGRRFWALFAEHFQLPAWTRNARNLRVRTEVRTDALSTTERRIDVLIELDGDAAVAIENKPWATDQADQVADYLLHLSRRYSNGHLLLYLSGNGRGPESPSIRDADRIIVLADGRFLVAGFADLLPWLAACRSACEAPAVTAFLSELETYIRAEFMGVQDSMKTSLIVEEATRNGAAVEAALEIARAVDDIRVKLLDDLEGQLRALIAEAHQPWTLTADTNWSAKGQGFSFQLASRDSYTVRFQFELSGLSLALEIRTNLAASG